MDLNYLKWCVTEKVHSTRKDLRTALISKKLLPFESQEQMQRMKNTEAKVLGVKRKLQGEGGEGGSGASEQSQKKGKKKAPEAVAKRKRATFEEEEEEEGQQQQEGQCGASANSDDVNKRHAECPHNRQRSQCRPCGGSSICEHILRRIR